MHEAVHPLLFLSARDAVDVCKVRHEHEQQSNASECVFQEEQDGDRILMACRNVTHPALPPSDDYVRTVQRLVGYEIRPVAKEPAKSEVKVSSLKL